MTPPCPPHTFVRAFRNARRSRHSITSEKKPVAPNAWTFWAFDWKNPEAGEHTLVSRAIDAEGRVQPSPDDPAIKLKPTYWEANQQLARRIRV